MCSNRCTGLFDEEDEHEFDYHEGGEKGPARWGELKEEWKACKTGRMQSPIDMSSRRVKVIPKRGVVVKREYISGNATVKNRGHDISVLISPIIDR